MALNVTRRNFLKSSVSSALALTLGVSGTLLRVRRAVAANSNSDTPLPSLLGTFESGQFNGDNATRPHNILWDKDNYLRSKGGRPTSFSAEKVVVVGGGMSGLLSAYQLRDFSPLLLEQASRFGGNSQGEKFGESTFSLGAAYLTSPDTNGDMQQLLTELGLGGSYRRENAEESRVCFGSHGLQNLWEGQTDPEAKESALAVRAELTRIYREAYPEIPWSEKSALSREEFQRLDESSAEQWLRNRFPRLHPHVEEYFQLYCWSSFGGSLEELSAAQFLNFVAAETTGVVSFPGGNSVVAEALYSRIPESRRKSGAMVIEISNTPSGVEVLYEDSLGTLKLVKASAVVVATPKYVARYLVKDLSPVRGELWKNLRYRAYVVANVRLSSPQSSPVFDSFCLEGKAPPAPTFGHRTDRTLTDFVFAGWASDDKTSQVLTFYRPFPFEGARSLISSDAAFQRIRSEFSAALPTFLQNLGLAQSGIDGIRLTRWGHALPLAAIGEASKASFSLLSEPHGAVFFANQDNLLNPSFETCLSSAIGVANGVRSLLG